MQTSTHRILSIIPGTRYLGIAILEGTNLKEWLVRSITGVSTTDKIRKMKSICEHFLYQHEIQVLAVKKLHPARSSQALNKYVTTLKETGKGMELTVMEFSIDQIKQLLYSGKANKRRLIEEVVTRYPFLHYELEREHKSRNRYFTRMFEAVALGSVCFQYLDNKGRKNK